LRLAWVTAGKGTRRWTRGLQFDADGKLGVSMRSDFDESRQVLSEQEEFDREDKRLLDVLAQGLSREFPNPRRVGCPDSAVLRSVAFRKLRLADAERWLKHLSSCSACFQEFSDFRRQAASQRRRTMAWTAAAAVLIFAVAGWLWVRVRTQHSVLAATEVLDLRQVSAVNTQNPTEEGRQTLVLYRGTRHLILDLPAGSNQGIDEIAIFSKTGVEILDTSGAARLEHHVVCVEVDVDVNRFQPGQYFLGVRQPGLTWAEYRVRVP
jgi:hypothetical protein